MSERSGDDVSGIFVSVLMILAGIAMLVGSYIAEHWNAGWAVRVLAWLLLASPL